MGWGGVAKDEGSGRMRNRHPRNGGCKGPAARVTLVSWRMGNKNIRVTKAQACSNRQVPKPQWHG